MGGTGKSSGQTISPQQQLINERGTDRTTFDSPERQVLFDNGYDKLPQVVDDEEFAKAVKDSSHILYRGLYGPDGQVADIYVDALLSGEYVPNSGGGTAYGWGMYAAAVPRRKGKFDSDEDDIARGIAASYGFTSATDSTQGRVITMAFKKGAKVVTYMAYNKLKKQFKGPALIDEMAKRGIAAYEIPYTSAKSAVVILDRSQLIINKNITKMSPRGNYNDIKSWV